MKGRGRRRTTFAASFALLCVAGTLAPITSSAVHPLEAEIAAFEDADREAPPQPGGIVFLGSSSVRMWHASLARDFAPLPVVGRGFGGSTYADAIRFADRLVGALRPRAIVLYEGDNDAESGMDAAAIAAGFDALRGRLGALVPGVRLYAIALKPSPARWKRWPAMRDANERIRDACEVDSLTTFVDVATPMLGANGFPRGGLFLPDSLHLNADGYALWTGILRPILFDRERGVVRDGAEIEDSVAR